MKKITAVILLVAIAFQVCSKLVVAGLFTINRQELTALFCINKQNPDAHCNGKCYMVKKMKEAESETPSNSSTPVKHKTSIEEVWICEHTTLKLFPVTEATIFRATSSNEYLFLNTSGIFQPPRA